MCSGQILVIQCTTVRGLHVHFQLLTHVRDTCICFNVFRLCFILGGGGLTAIDISYGRSITDRRLHRLEFTIYNLRTNVAQYRTLVEETARTRIHSLNRIRQYYYDFISVNLLGSQIFCKDPIEKFKLHICASF